MYLREPTRRLIPGERHTHESEKKKRNQMTERKRGGLGVKVGGVEVERGVFSKRQ